jgi:hypothetical protein
MNLPSLRMREAAIATILFGIGGLLLLPRDAPPSTSPAPPEVSLVTHQSSHSHDGVDFIPIKSIRVGQRVWVAEDAPGDGDLEFGEDVVPAQWHKMVLRCPKRDGTTAHVEMLRPARWLAERDVAAGGTVDIDVPECGISGRADVLAVEACPPIAPGAGRVVTSTFHHQAVTTIDIIIDGMDEPIGSTPNHPIWSETKQQFVRADALQPGEQVRTLTGLAQVVAIAPRGPPEPVYNLEVQVDHLFHVGTSGVLVHNNLPIINPCFDLKTVKHHIFNKFRGNSPKSQKYRDFFKKHGINVDDYAVEIPEIESRKLIHVAGNNWTTRWKNWIDDNPNATTSEVYQFGGYLMDQYGLSGLPIIPYK